MENEFDEDEQALSPAPVTGVYLKCDGKKDELNEIQDSFTAKFIGEGSDQRIYEIEEDPLLKSLVVELSQLKRLPRKSQRTP